MKRMLVFFMAILFVVLPVFSSCGGEEAVSPTVVISRPDVELSVGDQYTLSASVFPAKFNDLKIDWFSSDQNVVECQDGKLYAKAEGVALVYAAVGSARRSCKVTVSNEQRKMIIGESVALTAQERELIKSASEVVITGECISFDDGVITANALGNAFVKAIFENGDALTVASVDVRDISLTCEKMPHAVLVDASTGAEIEVYGLTVDKQLYEKDNYSVQLKFNYKLKGGAELSSSLVSFKIILYSGEVEGEFCREKTVSVKIAPGVQYEYVDDVFRARLNEEGNRTFWIEVVPVEEAE